MPDSGKGIGMNCLSNKSVVKKLWKVETFHGKMIIIVKNLSHIITHTKI